MPSPLGHALAGFAAGWLVCPAPPAPPVGSTVGGPPWFDHVVRSRRAWLFVAAGLAADLDLLAGLHSRYTHSVGAVLLASAVAFLWPGRHRRMGWPLSLAVAASYASHILLDWLASDTSPPLGIMALWPFDGRFFLSPVHVFLGISRKYWLAAAWGQDLVSVAWELAVLTPVAWAVGRFRLGGSP